MTDTCTGNTCPLKLQLEEKVNTYYTLLDKHTKEEMDKFNSIEEKFIEVWKLLTKGEIRDKLMAQQISFWTKVALAVLSGIGAILSAIAYILWEIAKHSMGIGG